MTTLFIGVPIDWPQANRDRASFQSAQSQFAQSQFAQSQFVQSQFIELPRVSSQELLGMQSFALVRGLTA